MKGGGNRRVGCPHAGGNQSSLRGSVLLLCVEDDNFKN